jgi:hypothetical protein
MITAKKSKALFFVLISFQIINEAMSSHFRGGTISWSPVNKSASPSATYVEVAITTRFFWTISITPECDTTSEKDAHPLIGDTTSITPLNGPASWSISSEVYCYDFSLVDDWSAGVRTQIVNVSTQVEVVANYADCCWVTGVTSVSGSNRWSLLFTINLKGAYLDLLYFGIRFSKTRSTFFSYYFLNKAHLKYLVFLVFNLNHSMLRQGFKGNFLPLKNTFISK